MNERLKQYQDKISSWAYQIKSAERNELIELPEDELKEMMSFFYYQDFPLNKLYAYIDRILNSKDITEIDGCLDDSWEIINNYLKNK